MHSWQTRARRIHPFNLLLTGVTQLQYRPNGPYITHALNKCHLVVPTAVAICSQEVYAYKNKHVVLLRDICMQCWLSACRSLSGNIMYDEAFRQLM